VENIQLIAQVSVLLGNVFIIAISLRAMHRFGYQPCILLIACASILFGLTAVCNVSAEIGLEFVNKVFPGRTYGWLYISVILFTPVAVAANVVGYYILVNSKRTESDNGGKGSA